MKSNSLVFQSGKGKFGYFENVLHQMQHNLESRIPGIYSQQIYIDKFLNWIKLNIFQINSTTRDID